MQPRAFLCHSSKDKPLVERLANDLLQSGVDVWFDKWEIKPGDSLRRRIDQGISTATHFLALLSPNSLESEWVQTELDAALVQRIAGACRLIPILCGVEDSEVPVTLRSIRWIRISDVSYDDGVRELVDACCEAQVKPPLSPLLHASHETLLAGSGLSRSAQRLAAMLNRHAVYGVEDEVWLAVESIETELGVSAETLLLVLDELREHGLVKLLEDCNSPIGAHSVGATPELFFLTDPVLRGSDPVADAPALAIAAMNAGGGSLDDLAQFLGWEVRRVNPAAYYLVHQGYAQGHASNSINRAFTTLTITPRGQRFALAASSRPATESIPSEKFVDPAYPVDVGIVAEEEASGFKVSWCRDDLLARKLDLESCEIVTRVDSDGRRVKFRLRDRPYDQTLIRKSVK
ncbi:MAG: toll/interleukin-1 receptor domain-containing protein [Deltaproteobacteria bacterium]|nr:toll/interleukin-1 receptor domain-containing protein [Deltaproteobacteria bacterium]MBI3387028.1 toll/interleukin-1 receptor domain-containing protein [Deltaproteobacteria bacterium]